VLACTLQLPDVPGKWYSDKCPLLPTINLIVGAAGESHMLFNLGGGANGTDLLLEVTYTPARHGEQVFETLAGGPTTQEQQQ
jgi:hypothetical protein